MTLTRPSLNRKPETEDKASSAEALRLSKGAVWSFVLLLTLTFYLLETVGERNAKLSLANEQYRLDQYLYQNPVPPPRAPLCVRPVGSPPTFEYEDPPDVRLPGIDKEVPAVSFLVFGPVSIIFVSMLYWCYHRASRRRLEPTPWDQIVGERQRMRFGWFIDLEVGKPPLRLAWYIAIELLPLLAVSAVFVNYFAWQAPLAGCITIAMANIFTMLSIHAKMFKPHAKNHEGTTFGVFYLLASAVFIHSFSSLPVESDSSVPWFVYLFLASHILGILDYVLFDRYWLWHIPFWPLGMAALAVRAIILPFTKKGRTRQGWAGWWLKLKETIREPVDVPELAGYYVYFKRRYDLMKSSS